MILPDALLDDFMVRATLAGLGVALAAGPLGCFVVWRRMAYFGDATAHAALLGVTLALVGELPMTLGVALAALAMATTVSLAAGRTYAMDTMLGVASHGALALGLVTVAAIGGVRVDLMGYLFGDILAVTRADLLVIWGGAAAVGLLLAWRWNALLLATLSDDLATAAGIDPGRERFVLTIALALLVAVAMKVVGVLLITAILIIPAAAARVLARTPETMAVAAVAVGALAVLGGLRASLELDTPAGPSVVTAAVILLVAGNLGAPLVRRGDG